MTMKLFDILWRRLRVPQWAMSCNSED